MGKMDEMVAVVPASVIEKFTKLPGLHKLSREDCVVLEAVLQGMEFRRRGDVEEDESVLQVIPYTYVLNETYDRVLTYVRAAGGGEDRLHGKSSIGLGGHLSMDDMKPGLTGWDLVYSSARRELSEELGLESSVLSTVALKPDALLFEDSTPVGRVHLGIVLQGWILGSDPILEPSPAEISALGWEPVQSFKTVSTSTLQRYEHWSQVVMNAWKDRGGILD